MWNYGYKIYINDQLVDEVETEVEAKEAMHDLHWQGYDAEIDYDYKCVHAYSVENEEEDEEEEEK